MIRYQPSVPLQTPSSFEFPFKPYKIQHDFMANLYSVIENKQIGIFESPTGTGKSLSLTCGALKWLVDHEHLVKQQLNDQINDLTLKIEKDEQSNEVNWLESQHEVILKKESLMSLKKMLERVNLHEKEMIEVSDRRMKEKAKVRYKGVKESESKSAGDDVVDKDEDDEFLIENYEDEDDVEAKDEKKYPGLQIFFCSRTHSQLTQVVNAIKTTVFGKSIRVVSLASRQSYCINDSVRKLNSNSLINDRCLELQRQPQGSKPTQIVDGRATKKKKSDTAKCCFYSKNGIENLRDESLSNILDIEELVKRSKSANGCPYYSSRLAAKDAHVIMIPYQMLLHKRTRIQSGLDLTNSIVIIDEAHNLVDSLTSVYSVELTLGQLQIAIEQLTAYKAKYSLRFSAKNLLKITQLIFVTSRLAKLLNSSGKSSSTRMISGYDLMVEGEFFNIKINEILDFCEKTRFAQKVQGFSQKFGTNVLCAPHSLPKVKTDASSFLKRLAEKQSTKSTKNKIKPTEDIVETPKKYDATAPSTIRFLLKFLECVIENIDDGRILMSFNGVTSKSSMKYVLLNPSGHINDILNECRSLIVAGGTMQPIAEFTNQLFSSHRDRVKDFSFSHVVPKENVLPLVVSTGPSNKRFLFNFTNRLNKEMLSDLSSTLRNICNVVPSGIVCFFGSYDYLDTFYSYLEESKGLDELKKRKIIFKEPRLSGQVEKMLAEYSVAVKSKIVNGKGANGAILFSVVGGKLSEGMNFSDDLARCVIVIGMPYPNKNNPELAERMRYLDSKFGNAAGAEYYENICIKSVNQCIGRAVRHIDDYASVLLLDERYSQAKVISKLPTWISNSLQCPKGFGMVQSSLVKFFKGKKDKI